MKENDVKILNLKSVIEEKKKNLQLERLKKEPRFAPITKCVFSLEGKSINIHTLGLSEIDYLIVYMEMWKQAGEACKLNPLIQGYTADEWQQDLISKKNIIQYNEKKKELDALQSKLDTLLSVECKTQLEIDNIADAINNL